MGLAVQTVALLRTAGHLVRELPADAVLLLTESDLDWDVVRQELGECKLLVAATNETLTAQLKETPGLNVMDIDAGPAPIQERMSLALLEAVATEKLRTGAHVVTVYNGLAGNGNGNGSEPIDTITIVHLGEHLERLSAQDLRNLDTQVPLETLRAVVDLATEIGREGREGKPVGTMFVVGDTRKVLSMARPVNFNPFRGYSRAEKDIRDPTVREQIKDIAQLEGALIIGRDGVAVAACMYIDTTADGITLSKGLGTRHWAAAAISRKTKAVAVCVSQSSGTVRIFKDGQVVLHIEPLARPMIWQNFKLETQEPEETKGMPGVS
jgi:DNA integrity scanning protein DisA with diadenylate cyclase activity